MNQACWPCLQLPSRGSRNGWKSCLFSKWLPNSTEVVNQCNGKHLRTGDIFSVWKPGRVQVSGGCWCVGDVSPEWASSPGRRRACWAQSGTSSQWRNPPGPSWRTEEQTQACGKLKNTQLTFEQYVENMQYVLKYRFNNGIFNHSWWSILKTALN